MRLAKPLFDVALNTERHQAHHDFWTGTVGLAFEEKLPIREGFDQYRYDLGGAVLKINCLGSVPRRPLAGYREVMIARPGLAEPAVLADPDGNAVRLVPPGTEGVHRLGLRIAVRDAAAHLNFFGEVLGFPVTGPHSIAIGDGTILLTEADDAIADVGLEGLGWRCLTIQIFELLAVHAMVVSRGAEKAAAPARLRDVARYSMIRDPDGNWIELSQRASLTGPLD